MLEQQTPGSQLPDVPRPYLAVTSQQRHDRQPSTMHQDKLRQQAGSASKQSSGRTALHTATLWHKLCSAAVVSTAPICQQQAHNNLLCTRTATPPSIDKQLCRASSSTLYNLILNFYLILNLVLATYVIAVMVTCHSHCDMHVTVTCIQHSKLVQAAEATRCLRHR
jgi:hypothetical protein